MKNKSIEKLVLRSPSIDAIEAEGMYYMKRGWRVLKPIHITDNFFKSLFNPHYAHFKLILYKTKTVNQ